MFMNRIGKLLLLILIVFVLLSVTFSCSKKEDKEEEKQVQKQKVRPNIHPEITKVEIDPPAPTSSDFIRALPELNYGLPQYITFHYQWFVNDQPVSNGNKKLLDKKHYKKGDTVYCRVIATRGKLKSKVVVSREIKIANSPPIINYSEVGSFNIPGEFRFTINATDPDGDLLTYRLLAPLNRGIVIDPGTGVIEWYIDEISAEDEGRLIESESITQQEDEAYPTQEKKSTASTVKVKVKPSPFVQIVFEVRDSDGAAATSSIHLNLKKGGEEPR